MRESKIINHHIRNEGGVGDCECFLFIYYNPSRGEADGA